MVPLKKKPHMVYSQGSEREEEDEMIYETIRPLTPKTLSSDACVPLLPLHCMLQAPW